MARQVSQVPQGSPSRFVQAVDGLGQQAGHGGLAAAAGTGKEVGVAELLLAQGRPQGAGHVGLAHDLGEGLGTVFAGDGLVGHAAPLRMGCGLACRCPPDHHRIGRAGQASRDGRKKWARLAAHTSKGTYRCYFPVLTELVLRRHTGPGPSYPRGSRRKPRNVGGDERARTADLLVANEALSQLSYIPNQSS